MHHCSKQTGSTGLPTMQPEKVPLDFETTSSFGDEEHEQKHKSHWFVYAFSCSQWKTTAIGLCLQMFLLPDKTWAGSKKMSQLAQHSIQSEPILTSICKKPTKVQTHVHVGELIEVKGTMQAFWWVIERKNHNKLLDKNFAGIRAILES